MADIDENTRNVGIGLIHGTTDTAPFKVNASNGKLRIEIVPRSIGTGLKTGIKIDENTRNVGAALTDDSSESITNLTVDEVVGFPCLRIET